MRYSASDVTCPHCNHNFPLTWRRYLGSPTGKHQCPSCGRQSRFKMTRSYVAMVAVSWLVFFGIAFALTVGLLRGRRAPGAIWIIIAVYGAGCAAIAMIDKLFDERFRKLEKIS